VKGRRQEIGGRCVRRKIGLEKKEKKSETAPSFIGEAAVLVVEFGQSSRIPIFVT